MVIYTTEATSVAEVQNAVETNFAGGCQATSESGETYRINSTCTGKLFFTTTKTRQYELNEYRVSLNDLH